MTVTAAFTRTSKLKVFMEKRKICIKKLANFVFVPEARDAMDKFKMEAANEVGVNLKKGDNGSFTSSEAGSVGGQMVKNMTSMRKTNLVREDRISSDHNRTISRNIGRKTDTPR